MRTWSLLCLIGALILTACSDGNPGGATGSNPGEQSSGEQSSKVASPALDAEAEERLKQDFATTPFKVLHIAELTYGNGPALAVTFSVPLDPTSDWQSYLHTAHQDGSAVQGGWILGEQLNTVYFPFVEPNTRYTVEVSQGLPAITGRMLEAGSQSTVRTGARERSVSFISQGTQLSPALSEEAVNVDARCQQRPSGSEVRPARLAGELVGFVKFIQKL